MRFGLSRRKGVFLSFTQGKKERTKQGLDLVAPLPASFVGRSHTRAAQPFEETS